MAINKTDNGHYICTDGLSIFHYGCICEGGAKSVATAQPYVISGTTEDEVYAKVFIDPSKEDGEYVIGNLTPKSKSEIIAEA